ncbi:sulfatase-like hydrolase/transferase [Pyrococcus kukulkanii]|uniref:sulfatase-like hydrolase/transferase n=1 Tax=Pyrococcus kukulkanii TaxID=1609559 RepID=UPI0035697AF5
MGYTTYLFSANIFVTPYFGFKGFDHFELITRGPPKIVSPKETAEITELSREGLFKATIKLIKRHKYGLLFRSFIQKMVLNRYFVMKLYSMLTSWPLDMGVSQLIQRIKKVKFNEPAFIMVNLMEMHGPYPTLINSIELNYITLKNWAGNINTSLFERYRKGYEAEIIYLSKKLPELLRIFKQKGLLDNSLVIITSDHGQLLGEHNKVNHGTFLYDELIRVPLWIRYPWEIKVSDPGYRYISLISLRKLILDIAKETLKDDGILYSPVVFSEVYGTHIDYSKIPLSPEERARLEELEKYRIAVYHKDVKAVFNVTDWKFEEVKSYTKGREVPEEHIKYIKKQIIKFLKTKAITTIPKGIL